MRYLAELEYITIVPVIIEANSEAEVRTLVDEGNSTEGLGVEDHGDPTPLPPKLRSVKSLGD